MVRIAAATTLRSLPSDQANDLLVTLLLDTDAECRQMAIEAVPPEPALEVRRLVEMLALTDPYPLLREMSAAILARSDEKPKGQLNDESRAGD